MSGVSDVTAVAGAGTAGAVSNGPTTTPTPDVATTTGPNVTTTTLNADGTTTTTVTSANGLVLSVITTFTATSSVNTGVTAPVDGIVNGNVPGGPGSIGLVNLST